MTRTQLTIGAAVGWTTLEFTADYVFGIEANYSNVLYMVVGVLFAAWTFP